MTGVARGAAGAGPAALRRLRRRLLGLLLLAGGCAMALYGPADWNGIAGAAVLFAAAAVCLAGVVPEMGGYPAGLLVGPAAGAVLCLLMIPEWCDLRRRIHANRMRKRARRRTGSR